MEYLRQLIRKMTGRNVPESIMEKAMEMNGDPIRRIVQAVLPDFSALPERSVYLTKKETDEMFRYYYNLLLPLRPVLCLLREQRRDRIQKVFEEMEEHTDRSTPPAGPEITRFFASEDEEDDAVYPEEVEEARKRKLLKRRRLLYRKRKKD